VGEQSGGGEAEEGKGNRASKFCLGYWGSEQKGSEPSSFSNTAIKTTSSTELHETDDDSNFFMAQENWP